MEEHLLNSLKVAEILHVSRSFAYLQMKHGDLPTVRIGNAIRVKATDLESFTMKRNCRNGLLRYSSTAVSVDMQ